MTFQSVIRCMTVLVTFAGATVADAQENRGTAEQRAACMPDAFRLCSSYIPDAAGVEHCLRQRRSDLSEACRAVFAQSLGQVASRNR